MGGISQYLAQELLDHLLGSAAFSAPGTLYLALYNVGHGTSALTEAALSGAEVTVTGYARQTITFAAAVSTAPIGALSVSDAAVTFTAGAGSEAADAWGLLDASSGGNLLFWGEIGQVNALVDTGGFTIPAGDVGCMLTGGQGGGVSDYAAAALLDLVLRATAYTSPSVYIGLSSVFVTEALSSADITGNEHTHPAYARQSLTFAAAATLGVGASIASNAAALFPIATENWDTALEFALYDAATVGNLLYWGRTDNPVAPLNGQRINFASGEIVATLGPEGGA